jgi:hypothetical protein
MSGGLNIVWDPAIDGGAWPGPLGERRAVVGETWLGPLGLLARLETDRGLGGQHPSWVDRAGDLVAKLATGNGWWRPSYDADAIGTCQRLLRDRDTLVLWGWQGEPASERLVGLWAATANALPGIPERLHAIHDALDRQCVDIDTVTVMSPIAALPPAWAQLFARLAAAGVAITEVRPTTAVSTGDLAHARTTSFTPTGDGSLTLLRPHGPLAAADEIAAWLAALPTLDGVLVVGGDEVLDAALGRHGVPRLGAAVPAPASVSLVRLVIEAAFEPMEPTDLHALLCLDPGPIPRRVAFRLIGALGEFPGRRSSAWREALAEGLARCDDEWRADVQARLEALLQPAAPRDGTIAAAEIARRLEIIAAWARTRMTASASLLVVAQLAAQARSLVDLYGASALSLVTLRRLCDELDDGRRRSNPGQAGLVSVPRPGAVLGPAATIVWWGFTRDSAPMPSRLRLSTQERDRLSALGVTPPDLGRAMEGEAARWRRPLEMATRSLVLVCPATGSTGEPSFPHPLWDELRAAMPRPDDAVRLEARRMMFPVSARRASVPPRALPVPTVEVRTGSAIAMRERESPSSLERLFGCSMAWALHYHGKLQPGRSAGPGAPSPLLYGKLAHALLALVFGDGALGADAAETRAKLVVETELANLCENLGLPRYHVERTAVKQAIVRTARELGALLAATGASVRGVEHEMTGVLEGVEVSGRADLVLSGPDVVIDLKWGRSSSYDKLLDGSALQLAAYAELHAATGSLPEVAYLTLQRQELLGQVGSTLPGIRILGTATARDTWSGARVALVERQAELAAGVLIAPAADGTEIESGLVGGRLTIAPGCQYCALSGLCGQGGFK